MDRKRPLVFPCRLVLAGLAVLILSAGAIAFRVQAPAQGQTQATSEDEKVWSDFIAWFKSATPEGDPFGAYAAELTRQGLAKTEIERRFGVIVRLFATRLEGIEVFYDKAYRRPATGDPAADGFASAPSGFLIGAVKGLKPGAALDVGMGQGRNAVELAKQGWTVTGFDLSGEAVAAAARNAQAAGVRIAAVKADYGSFDFGRDAWDLVVMAFAWAPVSDPAFVEKIRGSLKAGGLVVFEHFVDTPERRYAPMIRALQPGALREYFSGFDIVSYEETTGIGDWGGPGSHLVRMVARKR